MSAQHTPGPWTINEYDFDGEDMGIEILGNRGGQIPSVIVQTIMVDIKYGASVIAADRANARLIAAAPDLLAALKAAFDLRVTQHPEWEALARAAIARAEDR